MAVSRKSGHGINLSPVPVILEYAQLLQEESLLMACPALRELSWNLVVVFTHVNAEDALADKHLSETR